MSKQPGTYLYVGLKAKLVGDHPLMQLLNGRDSLHCTLMYGRVEGCRTPVLTSETMRGYGSTVISVAYIPHANCTCLILENTRELTKRHKYFADAGLDLGYEFEPHITVSEGNTVCEWLPLINEYVDLSDEYFQVIIRSESGCPCPPKSVAEQTLDQVFKQ